MKQIIYLMRHGQTLFNQRRKIQGACDSPLTTLGIAQANIAKQYFEDNRIVLDEAYSSTSERASDTLELITSLPYKRIKGIKEWNFGTIESESEDLNPPIPYKDFFVQFGGEEELEFRERMANAMLEIASLSTAATILVVSHGGACRQFMRAWEHKSSIPQQAGIGNCCILKFEFQDNEFELVDIINHDFSTL